MNHEWAAGLFEGEGYIRQFNPNHITYEVKIKMTDYDVLQRMQSLYGGYLGPTMKAKPHYKDIFEWALTSKSAVKEFLLNILPHLGLRRTYLAQNLLDAIDKTHTHTLYLMNKTKKRAAKRSNAKPTVTKFKWPYPLRSEFKIKNLKAYRDYHHSSLGDAKTAVETAMMSHLFP